MTRRRWLHLLIGLLVSGTALVIALKDAKLDVLVRRLSDLRWDLLILSGVIYFFIVIVFRALIVRTLLKHIRPVGVDVAYRYIFIGFLANNVLPFRLGEIVRPVLFGRRVMIPIAAVLAAMALERMLDMSMIAVLTGISSIVSPVPLKVKLAAAVTAVAMITLFALLGYMAGRSISGKKLLPSWIPDKISGPLETQALAFARGLSSLREKKQFALAILCSACLWLAMIPVLHLRIHSFGLDLPFDAGLFMLVSLSFSLALPSMPGYVGVYHLAVVFAMGVYGVAREDAQALALFSHAIDLVTVSAVGFVCLMIEGLKWGSIISADKEFRQEKMR